MAKVTAKSEFMENAFPAGQLKVSGNFEVVQDANGEHMIFFIDSRGRLCMIVKGLQGNNEWVNLSKKFGLNEGRNVTAFAVSQNRNGNIHLVFTVRQQDGSDRLYVVQPKAANKDQWLGASDMVQDLYDGEQFSINVREIMLGTSNDSVAAATSYPQIHLVFNHIGKATQDIWAISVNPQTKTWKNQRAFQMPMNSDQIVDKCVANLRLYRGLFVLFRSNASLAAADQLRFVGLDPTKTNPTLQTIVQQLPPGANRIASFDNSKGFTDLLVGGNDLTWRSAQDAFTGSRTAFTTITPSLGGPSLKQLKIVQYARSLSVWSLTQDAIISYQELSIQPNLSVPTTNTPLLPLTNSSGAAERFAAMQNHSTGQKLFVLDQAGSMKMLEQDSRTGLWESPIDVMIPDSNEFIQFKSHTVRVRITDGLSGTALPAKALHLRCSTSAELLVNGSSVRGSADGTLVKTDLGGELTIIIKSDSLSAPILSLKGAEDPNLLLGGTIDIDPMVKLWSVMDTMKTKDDLKRITTADGGKAVSSSLDDTQLDKAAQTIQKLSTVRRDIISSAANGVLSTPAIGSTESRQWGAFQWIRKKARQAWNWVVEKADGVWRLVVEFAGKVWNFVLETVSHIAAALEVVMGALGKAWEWIKEKIEFFFSWDDILDTKNILANLTTQGLLMGVEGVSEIETRANDYFEDLKARVRALKTTALPSQMADMKAGGDKKLEDEARAQQGNSAEEDALNSPAAGFGNYHLSHSSSSQDVRSEGETMMSRVLKRLGDVWRSVEDLAARLQVNLAEVMKKKDFSVDNLLQKVGVDLLENVLNVVQQLVIGLLGSIGDLILELADGINRPISIPVLSPLYKKLTRGSDLTILDAISLLLAIPATFIYKATSLTRPSQIQGIGSLITPNAMKPELDRRMGRIRSEGLGSKSTGSLKNAYKSTQEAFAQQAHLAEPLVKIAVPTGAQLYYTFKSWPGQMVPEPAPIPWKCALSAAGNLFVWLAQFGMITRWTKEKIQAKDFSLPWQDEWFRARFYIWMPGVLPVFGSFGGKYVEALMELMTASTRIGLLAYLQIESLRRGPGYSIFLAVEEWAILSGKIMSAISSLSEGGGFIIAPIALSITTSGNCMRILRAGLENSKFRDVVQSGLEVEC